MVSTTKISDVKTNHGYCNVTKIIWMEKLCHEQDSITKILYEYYEPIVQVCQSYFYINVEQKVVITLLNIQGFFIEPQKEFEINNDTVNGQIEYLDVFTKWSLAYNQLMLNRSVMPKTTDDKKLVVRKILQISTISKFTLLRYNNNTSFRRC